MLEIIPQNSLLIIVKNVERKRESIGEHNKTFS